MGDRAWGRVARVERDGASELAMMVVDTGIDGVFLDSMREAPVGVRAKLDAAGRPGGLTGGPDKHPGGTARRPACFARSGSSRGTCSTKRVAGTAIAPRSCAPRGSTARACWCGRT